MNCKVTIKLILQFTGSLVLYMHYYIYYCLYCQHFMRINFHSLLHDCPLHYIDKCFTQIISLNACFLCTCINLPLIVHCV